MVWALALIAVIGVGLPLIAWAVTRRLPPPRPGNRLGVGYDSVDKWLLTRHQLLPHDRWRVREAVFHGDQVNDPALAGIAHELAARLLAGKFWVMRFWYLMSWIMLLAALVFVIAGVIELTTPSGGVAQGIVSLIDSGLFGLAAVFGRLSWRWNRNNLVRALQLNGGKSTPGT